MLKNIEQQITVQEIEFEPGDATRYSFFVAQDFDTFLIMPNKSTFKLPNRLNKFDIIAGVEAYEKEKLSIEESAKQITDERNINPNTVLQIARAIYKIYIDTEANIE